MTPDTVGEKPSEAPPSRAARLSPAQIRAAIPRLQRLVAQLERFDPPQVKTRTDPVIPALSNSVVETLVDIYGANTTEFERYSAAKNIDTAPFLMNGTPIELVREGLQKGKAAALGLLLEAIATLEGHTRSEAAAPAAPPIAPTPAPATAAPPAAAPMSEAKPAAAPAAAPLSAMPKPLSREVFVVHGGEIAASERIAAFLAKAELVPVAVKAIAREVLRQHVGAGFAVILAPEGEGAARSQRQREEEIAQLFYLLGSLGHGRVCVLAKSAIELPSEPSGIVIITFDPYEGWQKALLRSLEASGYQIDWAKALR